MCPNRRHGLSTWECVVYTKCGWTFTQINEVRLCTMLYFRFLVVMPDKGLETKSEFGTCLDINKLEAHTVKSLVPSCQRHRTTCTSVWCDQQQTGSTESIRLHLMWSCIILSMAKSNVAIAHETQYSHSSGQERMGLHYELKSAAAATSVMMHTLSWHSASSSFGWYDIHLLVHSGKSQHRDNRSWVTPRSCMVSATCACSFIEDQPFLCYALLYIYL